MNTIYQERGDTPAAGRRFERTASLPRRRRVEERAPGTALPGSDHAMVGHGRRRRIASLRGDSAGAGMSRARETETRLAHDQENQVQPLGALPTDGQNRQSNSNRKEG